MTVKIVLYLASFLATEVNLLCGQASIVPKSSETQAQKCIKMNSGFEINIQC